MFKQILLYLFFGGCTFVVSMVSYIGGEYILHLNPLVANIFSWVLAVTFAYITNRIWVFDSKASRFKAVLKEIILFYSGRLVTLGIEEVILWIGIILMKCDSIGVKIVAQLIVIISNYFISKLFVFERKNND